MTLVRLTLVQDAGPPEPTWLHPAHIVQVVGADTGGAFIATSIMAGSSPWLHVVEPPDVVADLVRTAMRYR